MFFQCQFIIFAIDVVVSASCKLVSLINDLSGELEDWESSSKPTFLVSFAVSRASIPAIQITRLGDRAEGQSSIFVELRSRGHRPETHLGSQGIDSRG